MLSKNVESRLWDTAIIKWAIYGALQNFHLIIKFDNPVMFSVYVGSILTT